MELCLKRRYCGATYTIGSLYVDNRYFCDTLEDTARALPAVCPDTPVNKESVTEFYSMKVVTDKYGRYLINPKTIDTGQVVNG